MNSANIIFPLLLLLISISLAKKYYVDSLDITEILEAFEDCNVQIVTSVLRPNNLFNVKKPIKYPPYVVPSNVPVVLIQYTLEKQYFELFEQFKCGRDQYFKMTKYSNDAAGKAISGLKALDRRHRNVGVMCDAWMYICPLHCKTWDMPASWSDVDSMISTISTLFKNTTEIAEFSRAEPYLLVVGKKSVLKNPAGGLLLTNLEDYLCEVYFNLNYLNNWKDVLLEIGWNHVQTVYQIKKRLAVNSNRFYHNLRSCVAHYDDEYCWQKHMSKFSSVEVELRTMSAVRHWPHYNLNWEEHMFWNYLDNSNIFKTPNKQISTVQINKFYMFHGLNGIPVDIRDATLLSFSMIFPNATLANHELMAGSHSPILTVAPDSSNLAQYVMTQKKGVSFLICSPITESDGLSISGFVAIFDWPTWVLLMTAAVISGICRKMLIQKKSNVFGFLLPIFVLLEQGTTLIRKCKPISVAWILTGIVISNLYRGDNINNLIAPIQNRKLDSFDSLLKHNFSFVSAIYTPVDFLPNFKSMLQNIYEDDDDAYDTTRDWSKFWMNYVASVSAESPKLINEIENRSIIVNMKQALSPGYIVKFVSSCKRKQLAFIDDFYKIHHEYLKLKQKTMNTEKYDHVTIGKKPLGDTFVFWYFLHVPVNVDKLFSRLDTIKATGFPQIWDKWIHRLITWNDTVTLAKLQ